MIEPIVESLRMMTMNKLTILITALLVVGCTPRVRVGNEMVVAKEITKYVVEGKVLECITTGYQLSCNWEKYNKQKEVKNAYPVYIPEQ